MNQLPRISRFLIMTAQTETQVRLFASAQSWIEGEAVRHAFEQLGHYDGAGASYDFTAESGAFTFTF